MSYKRTEVDTEETIRFSEVGLNVPLLEADFDGTQIHCPQCGMGNYVSHLFDREGCVECGLELRLELIHGDVEDKEYWTRRDE